MRVPPYGIPCSACRPYDGALPSLLWCISDMVPGMRCPPGWSTRRPSSRTNGVKPVSPAITVRAADLRRLEEVSTTQRTLLASALRLSVDSIGRYAREGRIPFDQTPGGHRRFDLDEVRLALDLAGDGTVGQIFGVPAATLRLRELRSVSTPQAQPLDRDAPIPVRCSAADELLSAAWRVQRGVPLTTV